VEPQNEGGGGFPGLCLKTGSYGLVIWASKSLRRFLGLGLKIKQATICRLRHNTEGRVTAWDTHRDLVSCFVWKHVGLGFPSLATRLVEARRNQVKDGRVNAMGYVRPCYPCFVIFFL
jgi:hypothetical protein